MGSRAWILIFVVALLALLPEALRGAPTWSVHAQFSGTSEPTSTTRNLRSLALSSDDSKLFLGFIEGDTTNALMKVDAVSGAVDATVVLPTSRRPKAVATDDRGYVYAGLSLPTGSPSGGELRIYDSSLSLVGTASPPGTEMIGGASVRKVGSTYYLYIVRDRQTSPLIQRYNVTNPMAITLDTSFGTGGSFNLNTFFSGVGFLRGMEVAQDGTIFIASSEAFALYRISADLASATTHFASRPMDIALYGDLLIVSQWSGDSSDVEVIRASDLTKLDHYFTNVVRDDVPSSGYTGIDVTADGRIFMADQFYSFTDPFTYGDRILVSTPLPEPGAMFGMAAALLCAMRRRRR